MALTVTVRATAVSRAVGTEREGTLEALTLSSWWMGRDLTSSKGDWSMTRNWGWRPGAEGTGK